MAEVATEGEVELGGEELADSLPVKKKWFSGKNLVLYIALPMLLIGVASGLIGTGIIDMPGQGGDDEVVEAEPDPVRNIVFYDLPDLLVNLNSKGRRASYLKMRVSLEVSDAEHVEQLEAMAPRIIDNFQVYLRELRANDLRGSAGMARLREELLRRVNAAVDPIEVHDVLFREMLVQ